MIKKKGICALILQYKHCYLQLKFKFKPKKKKKHFLSLIQFKENKKMYLYTVYKF